MEDFYKTDGGMGMKVNRFAMPVSIADIRESVSPHTVDVLKSFRKAALSGDPVPQKKADLVSDIASGLDFRDGAEFGLWFLTLPSLLQIMLYRGAFAEFLPVAHLEREVGAPLLVKQSDYWSTRWVFTEAMAGLDVDFLTIHSKYACPAIKLPGFLRLVLRNWLVPPFTPGVPGCRVEIGEDAAVHDASGTVADTLPLLYDAVVTLTESADLDLREKYARGGFRKKDIEGLRAASGFRPFRMEGDLAPHSVDLAARFLLCMTGCSPKRPDDARSEVRSLTNAFFEGRPVRVGDRGMFSRSFLEFGVCLDHLTRPPGFHFVWDDRKLPPSRPVFREMLMRIAADGGWFDADALAERAADDGRFFIQDGRIETTMRMKADSLEFEGLSLLPGYNGDFSPEVLLFSRLLQRPLFKAYCFLFASLGILEIVQTEPELARLHKGKRFPLSPYDSLKAIRITALGKWCLGLTAEPPPLPVREFRAIADRELLLVTVQGESLELRLFLDGVGRRLGENRWRISPDSFISGCQNPRQIQVRIERFKALIDPAPAPHWEAFFGKLVVRSGLFDSGRQDILVFDLPEGGEIREEILGNREIRRIVYRAEGLMLLVERKNRAKFFGLLAELGISHFDGGGEVGKGKGGKR